ncbi:MAG TPA: methylated-DNA--[protein]-cysteine S-methyltransferase [Ohtaekwangia sp.]|nr:methylated-DNA--[protein]-cysteine S-methyltransferase [Ohtaekwangia sp.]
MMDTTIVTPVTGRGYYSSPIGELVITSQDEAITSILFIKDTKLPEHRTAVIQQCIEELDEYFFKGRKFFNVEILLRGTEFQKKIWNELLTIPYGKTMSYEALAIQTGDIKSIRAVGLANGQNPISIIVPCHRVIGKNGDLTGYTGGIENKEWLLSHEGSVLKQLTLF